MGYGCLPANAASNILAMGVSKGLEFQMVALSGVEDLGWVEEMDPEAEVDMGAEIDTRRAAAQRLILEGRK